MGKSEELLDNSIKPLMNPFTDFFASSFHCMLDSKSCSTAADSYLCFVILSFPLFDKLKAIKIEELFNFRN